MRAFETCYTSIIEPDLRWREEEGGREGGGREGGWREGGRREGGMEGGEREGGRREGGRKGGREGKENKVGLYRSNSAGSG